MLLLDMDLLKENIIRIRTNP